MDDLKDKWIELASKYTKDTNLISSLWNNIVDAYSDSKRAYHNLDHLKFMFDKMESVKGRVEHPDTIAFSIFYHDIIYKMESSDNEQSSAELAHNDLAHLNVPEDQIEKCYQQIIATKDHEATEDNDTNLLIDIDIAILGAPKEIYEAYSQKVRKEYSKYPDAIYANGRKKILKGLLDRTHLYTTTFFQNQLETNARRNMLNELSNL